MYSTHTISDPQLYYSDSLEQSVSGSHAQDLNLTSIPVIKISTAYIVCAILLQG